MSTIGNRIRIRRQQLNLSQYELAKRLGYKSRSSINKIELDERNLTQSKIKAIADALETTPAYIMGWEENSNKLKAPKITDDVVTFPVIGEIAAGYDNPAIEDWSGETTTIPSFYLKGRKKEDFFVLTVKGASMYPMYIEGDKVLILKQESVDSGEVCAILYDEEMATLKKVEYKPGENWLKLIPINPEYAPRKIENEELETCRVIGIPILLIREIGI